MLVVDSIVPGSLAEQLLEPGDVLTKVDGSVVTHFLTLESIFDAAVGQSVTLDLERGGQKLQANVQVYWCMCSDLHDANKVVSHHRPPCDLLLAC